jgi:hypothetical protein
MSRHLPKAHSSDSMMSRTREGAQVMSTKGTDMSHGGDSTLRRVGAGIIGGRSWRRLVTMLGLRSGSVLTVSSGQGGGGGGAACAATGRPGADGGERNMAGEAAGASPQPDSPRCSAAPPLQVRAAALLVHWSEGGCC